MARLYADENFPYQVVEHLRQLGHDVVTTLESEQADRSVPDDEVLIFASRQDRALLTLNRWDFVALHRLSADHVGMIVCSVDVDAQGQAERINEAIQTVGDLAGKLVRVNLESASKHRAPRFRNGSVARSLNHRAGTSLPDRA